MKLSLHRDLILVIISSLAVLIISWLQLVKGNVLTFMEYVSILLLPGYSIITAIWPGEEKMEWSLRAGVGFVLGLFFILFLPLILESLMMGSYNDNLINILLILAVLFSLIAVIRRKDPSPEEPYYDGRQLTLEESVERASELRDHVLEEHGEEDPYEYYDEDVEYSEYRQTDDDEDAKQGSVPLAVDEEIISQSLPTEYEEEMDKPIWMDDELYEESHVFGWYSFLKKIFLVILIIGVFLFVLDFLGWDAGFLKEISQYSLELIVLSAIIMVAMILLPKLLASEEAKSEEETQLDEEAPYTEIPREESPDEMTHEMVTSEEVPLKKEEEKTMPRDSESGDHLPDEDHEKSFPTYKPRNYYLDLIIIVVLTLLTVVFVLIPPLNKSFIRTILGILLVLFIPGYSLIAALFPRWGDLDGIERAALSFGLSIAVTPLIGLALNYTPWGIRLDPILISLTIFTMAMCLIACIRRRMLPDAEKYFVPLGELKRQIKGSFKSESKTEKILSIILIISIILAISTTLYIIVKPKQGEKFTEFYILGPDGKASNYPTNLTHGQKGEVIIGVVNHEYATTDYKILVKVKNHTLHNQTLTLKNGEKREIPFNFTAGNSGNKKMQFLLYKLPDQKTAYRSLHLWLNITT
ncbi:DUF1616 domain-containing protein [Methanobacterium sp. MZD130B]|uniref:DUF1616 domain-containing protein n=1 Tax=Methanobacterium sp. MZD130B TaxID=3394378 RepID=UPI0039FCF76D